MADRWVVAYDIDTIAASGAHVTVQTVYNRIKAVLKKEGFSEQTQLSIYAMPDEDGALVRVYNAIQKLKALNESKYIKRLHVFKIDGAMNDLLPLVNGRASGDVLEDEEVAPAA
ncbi:hypothetical protein [Pseudomonas mosselii]|uniref:hypothetical protein n=1 Tax=Pseudomonas mosselii TaxID=78327 RepID=UPI001A9CE44C|nr:hypothetical protein [Pseudomonas mosselii]MCH7418446.1 hypothetical protein [Pseudomonas mosselii]